MTDQTPFHAAVRGLGKLRSGVESDHVVTLVWQWVTDAKAGILDARLSKGEKTKIMKFGKQASELKKAMADLPPAAREYVEHSIANRVIGGSSYDAKIWYDKTIENLLELERIVDDAKTWIPKPQPAKVHGDNRADYMWRLMDVFLWATGVEATRTVDGPFLKFAAEVWPMAFGSTSGLDTALKKAVAYRSRAMKIIEENKRTGANQQHNYNNWLMLKILDYGLEASDFKS